MSELLMQLEFSVLTVKEWPNAFFEGILSLFGDQGFLSLPDSWKLAYFLNNNWSQLTDEQKMRFREGLAGAFDRYKDWMGAFVTSEILGERYADQPALQTLTELARTAQMPARAAVPHGLELFAKATREESLRSLAMARLLELASSVIPEVQQEASLSLQRLAREQ
jgi:hypothetical protein